METNDIQAIMKKLTHLQKLAERPGTPEEAAVALAAIQRLMAKYRVTEAELIAAGSIEPGATIHEEMMVGSNLQWRKVLMQELARANNCAIVFNSSGPGFHIFGKEHHMNVAVAMYEYLAAAVERLADEGWANAGSMTINGRSRTFNGTSKRHWKHAFRVGASDTIVRRVREQALEAKRGIGRASELMVADASEAQLMLNELFGRTTSRRSSNPLDAGAMRAGNRAGGGVNLDGQINGGSTRTYRELNG